MAGEKAKKILSNNAIRALVFMVLIVVSLVICSHILDFEDAERSETVVDEYYELDADTVDCIYLGSSSTQRAFVTPVAFHDDGVAAYSYTCGTQPFVLTKFLIEETLKTQDPKVVIVELRGACKSADELSNVAARRMLDNMKPSMNRYRAIRYMLDYASQGDNEVDSTGLSYYFPIIQYHSRWNPSKTPHYLDLDYYKGYGIDPDWTFRIEKIDPPKHTVQALPIAPEAEKVLADLLDYCDGIKTQVLFVVSPYEASLEEMQKINTCVGMVRERGYECLDFLREEEREAVGLQDDTCYYNREHLSYYGALKYTHFISRHIRDNYGVGDRREDPACAGWRDDHKRLEKNLRTIYADKYESMMSTVNSVQNGSE